MAKGEKIDKETRRRLEEFLRPGREEDFGLACKIIRDPKFMIWFPEHDIARNIQDLHKLSKQLGWPIPEEVQARIR
ncbi:MAG: hypothetical protein JXB14_00690 [Candidatus Altiarchaeota archaeon]|nr:hypothetical protein [Candidatus Altiarchaeota archaeon]